LNEGDVVPVEAIEPVGHTTSPPARYTEASLVKKLEELGIGRPSTYASIISTLQARYVWKKGQALIPNWEAFAVVALMEKYFVDLVDYEFTRELEEDLDQIANAERDKVEFLKEFYWGDEKKRHPGLKQQVAQNIEKIDAAEINSIFIGKDPNGVDIVVKPGRYGPYLKRGEDTVPVPDSLPPDELTVEKALALLSAPKGDTPLGVDPATGLNVYVKQGRFGPYVQLGEATNGAKPKTASLFRGMKPESVTLDTALKLLSLPRVVGVAEDGETIIAQNGRYGPYLTKGKESRNLGVENEAKLFTITLEEAVELFKQPRQYRGRGSSKPATIIGKDPETGKDLQLKEGRFGWYITDGETNASLRKGDDPATLTLERALELMAQRREYLASPEGQAKAASRGAKKAAKRRAKADGDGDQAPKSPAPAPEPPAKAVEGEPQVKRRKAAKAPAKQPKSSARKHA
jgi:DNA topoisomerase-1